MADRRRPMPPFLADAERDALLAAAEAALRNAHAPYSGLRVGAAVLSSSGHRHAGCNVENRAYPLGGCAEHHAIAAAVLAEGPGLRLHAVAIAARDADDRPVPIPPCGGCRQKLMEFGDDLAVIFLGRDGVIATHALRDLLPAAFELPASPGAQAGRVSAPSAASTRRSMGSTPD